MVNYQILSSEIINKIGCPILLLLIIVMRVLGTIISQENKRDKK